MALDEKYVIFKKDEFQAWLESVETAFGKVRPLPELVDDGTVIRRQDVFAAPVLYLYAHNIALVAEVLTNQGLPVPSGLERAGDYFAQAAEEAIETEYRKLPD